MPQDALDVHLASELRRHDALIQLFGGFAANANFVLGALDAMQPADWYCLGPTRDKLRRVARELGERLLAEQSGAASQLVSELETDDASPQAN